MLRIILVFVFGGFAGEAFSQSVANSGVTRRELSDEPFMLRVMYPVVDEMRVVHFLTVPVFAKGGAPFNVPRILGQRLRLPVDGEEESGRDSNLISLKGIRLYFREVAMSAGGPPTLCVDVTGFAADVLPEVSMAQAVEATILCLRESFPLGQSATLNLEMVGSAGEVAALGRFNGPLWRE